LFSFTYPWHLFKQQIMLSTILGAEETPVKANLCKKPYPKS
jgi:hypothetical protein